MNTWICLAAVLGPLAHFVSAALAERRADAKAYLGWSRATAGLGFLSSSIPAVCVFAFDARWGSEWTYRGLGIELLLDRLSVTFALVIGALGFVILDFSRKYMSGDGSHVSFMGRLHATLGLVTLLCYSGNLLQLVALWSLTSLALHRLLFFYRQRPKVQRAAAQKFRMARAGDLLLAASCALLYQAFGTGSVLQLRERVGLDADISAFGSVTLAAVLLVLAASLKSGQVPNHVWLPDVVEAPTPVSALLHAGIVNGGGFLVLRFADVVSASGIATTLLLVLGGVSALWGSLVMLTKSSVKEALAYSTVSQMGLMLFECAVGAYELALLHIVAHSAYKAYSFLAAGELSDPDVRSRSADTWAGFAGRWVVSAALLAAGATLVSNSGLGDERLLPLGESSHLHAGKWILLAIVASAMALVSSPRTVASNARDRKALVAFTASLTLMLGLGGAYLLAEYVAERLWLDLATRPELSPLTGALGMVFALACAGVACAQALDLSRSPSALVQRVYLHLRRDAFARQWFERCWGAATPSAGRARRGSNVLITKETCQEV